MIGAIDGKLIAIQKPSIHGNAWIDRHNNPSMNLLAVCDANRRFMFIRTGQTGMYSQQFYMTLYWIPEIQLIVHRQS